MDQVSDHNPNYFASVLELFTIVCALTTPKTFSNRLLCSYTCSHNTWIHSTSFYDAEVVLQIMGKCAGLPTLIVTIMYTQPLT